MSDFASRLKSLLFGSRDEQLSIPIMDGALKPNNALEEAPILCERRGLEDLAVAADGELYAACGPTIVRVGSDGVLTEVARFERDVTALAACPDGRLAAGLGDAIALDALRRDGPRIDTAAGQRLNAVNAIAAAPAGGLLIADGSTIRPYAQWCYDLLEKGRTGRIVACGADGRARNLAAGMEYAFGVLAEADGQALAAETWRHQLVRVGAGAKAPALANIAGYPARMTRAAGGGF
ncbi:MAG: hypothetical protein ABSC22_04250, partial [Roseiarcus sp.]